MGLGRLARYFMLFPVQMDETGNVNVIVWPALVVRQRQEAYNTRLLGNLQSLASRDFR
jgi:hypothetical protein